jgi:hypothetical protein
MPITDRLLLQHAELKRWELAADHRPSEKGAARRAAAEKYAPRLADVMWRAAQTVSSVVRY